MTSARPINQILKRVNRNLELAYAGLVVWALLIGAASAWVVGRVVLAGSLAAFVAGVGGFIVALGIWRTVVLRPTKRRASRELAVSAESFEPSEFATRLDALTFASALWQGRDASRVPESNLP